MNRWHPPETKTPSLPRSPAPPPAEAPVALEMQMRAMREALDRAVRAGENALAQAKDLREALDRAVRAGKDAQAQAKELREELVCERLHHADVRLRYKQFQEHHKAKTVGESETLQKENRRLRTMLAEASMDRGKLLEEFRARAPFERFGPAVPEEEPGVSFESPEPAPSRSGSPDHRQRASQK